jgi:hypothetical protein
MKRPRQSTPLLVFTAFVVVMYLVLFVLQAAIDDAREGLLTPGEMSARDRLVDLGATVMLGSFRTVAVDYLWYKASMLKERREWIELDGVIRLIARVQPTNIEAYAFQVWNMAYNVQYDAATVVEGWRWVEKAIEFGEEGLQRNPNHPKVWRLYWQIGWVYSHRCGNVVGPRTRYFSQQVRKKHGTSPYLVAADYYRRAFEAATREDGPRPRNPNPHFLAMWAYSYSSLADQWLQREDADADIRYARMMEYRREAIEKHRLVMKAFPDYRESGEEKIAELTGLMDLHRERRRIDENRAAEKLTPEQEIAARFDVARRWLKLLLQNPTFKEAQRNVDRCAQTLDERIRQVNDPQARARWQLALLRLRFDAAHPKRRSAAAAEALAEEVEPHDRRLRGMAFPELVRNSGLVRLVAAVWHRVLVSAPPDADRSARAADAFARYDRVAARLPEKQQAAARAELDRYWLALISRTPRESPTARARVLAAAKARGRRLAQTCEALMEALRELKGLAGSTEPAAQAEQTQRMAQIGRLAGQEDRQFNQALSYWSALLKKDPAYAAEAAEAEQHLAAIAERLEAVAEAHRAVFGAARNPFARQAGWVWRLLHEFAPANGQYLKKLGRPVTTGPPSGGSGP